MYLHGFEKRDLPHINKRSSLERFRFPRWREFWTRDINSSCVIWRHAFNLKFRRSKQTWKQSFWGWPLTCGHDVTVRRSRSGKRLSKPPYCERDGSRHRPLPLDNWIRWLCSANQNAHHKHWIVFSAYTKWVVFFIVHCMTQAAMMAYIGVQCILDCLSVSVSTELVYSDDQFTNSYSNPYKLCISGYCWWLVLFV